MMGYIIPVMRVRKQFFLGLFHFCSKELEFMEAAGGAGVQKSGCRGIGGSDLGRCKSLDLGGKLAEVEAGDAVGNPVRIKLEKDVAICGAGASGGRGAGIAGGNGGGGPSCVEGGGVGDGRKKRRLEGFKYREKVSIQNVVVVLDEEEGDASGEVEVVEVVTEKKLGKPTGSKNMPKSAVGIEVDAPQVGKDASIKAVVVKDKRRGKIVGSIKRKTLAIEDECGSVRVRGDISGTTGAGFVKRNEDVGSVGVSGSGQVLGTYGVMQPVGTRDKCRRVGLSNNDVVRNIGYDGSIRIPEFSGLGSEGWDAIVNKCGFGWSMGSVFNVNQERLVELNTRGTDIEHQTVERKRVQGRPKCADDKMKALLGTDVEKNYRVIDLTSENNGDGNEIMEENNCLKMPMSIKNPKAHLSICKLQKRIESNVEDGDIEYLGKKNGQGRPSCSKNRNKEKEPISDDHMGL